MSKLIALTKIQVKDFIGKYTSSLGVKNKLLGRALLLVLAGVLAVPAGSISLVIYDSLAAINQSELMITSMYINSVIFMFIFGIPFIVSVFFFSRDARFLSALPLQEDDLILSKLATVYIYLLAISTLILGPTFGIYLYKGGISLYLILAGLIALVLAPVLPLLISSLVIIPFGNIFSRSSQRKNLILIFNVLLLAVIIISQLYFGRYMEDPALVQEFLVEGNFLELVGMSFPPSIWLTRMMTGSFLNGGLFVGINLVLFFLLKYTSRLFFRKSLLAFSEEGGDRQAKIYFKQRSKGWQLIKRNILIILKEPMFLMNNGLTLIAPIFVFAIMYAQGNFNLTALTAGRFEQYLPYLLSLALVSPAIMGNISATAITREGQSFWETRVLPIPAAENIKYRVLTTIFLSLTGSVIMLIITLFIVPFSIRIFGLAALFCLSTTFFLSGADMIINLHRPLLNWTNPTAAVKNNLNVIFSLIIRAIIGFLFYLIYRLFPGVVSSPNSVILVTSIIFAGLYLLVHSYLYSKGARIFDQISL
ncbi:MAG: hypothetical protein ACOCQF_01655 [Halanaerobiaceae bacterium]